MSRVQTRRQSQARAGKQQENNTSSPTKKRRPSNVNEDNEDKSSGKKVVKELDKIPVILLVRRQSTNEFAIVNTTGDAAKTDVKPTNGRMRKLRQSVHPFNYNENEMSKKSADDFFYSDSYRQKARPSISRTNKKQPKYNVDSDEDEEILSHEENDEVDENVDNANITVPKRPRLTSGTAHQSSIKASLRTPAKKHASVTYETPKGKGAYSRNTLPVSPSSTLQLDKLKIDSPSTPHQTRNIATNKLLCKRSLHADLGDSDKSDLEQRIALSKGYTECSEGDDDYDNDDDDDDNYIPDKSEEVSSSSSSDSSGDDDSDNCENQGVKPTTYKPKNTSNPKTPRKSTKISMETPTKKLSRLSLNVLTPSVHRRTMNIAKPSTPLQEARQKLHVSVLPKSLPCREEQFNDIYTFLHARLSDHSGGCIYISGVPGTGKTATVNEVIRCLQKSSAQLDEFKFIDINGMKLAEPRQAYVQILKQLTGETKTWEEAQKLLHQRFTKSNAKSSMTLLLVDELDLLCTKRQDVVYNLLDWPSKNAKLVVVTIANTMDLPERILMGKVTSRLGLTRLTFPPYNYQQLEEIVISRLRNHNAFSNDTIQLVARKVAAVSGDARRALDICRRSTEVAEINGRETVTMIDVKQALDEMIASPKIQAIKHCSVLEQLFLQSVCNEVTRSGVEEVGFLNVYNQLTESCRLFFKTPGERPPNVTQVLAMCARLGSYRLLLCEHSRMDIHQRIMLNVSSDDVYFATKDIKF